MQTLEQVAQIADGFYDRLYDRKTRDLTSDIEELKDQYLDDSVMLVDILMDEDCVDADEMQETLRAATLALKYETGSFEAFAKSYFQMLLDGVQKRAEMRAE